MATDPRPQSSTSFRGGGALGGGENLLDFEEGKKAAAKAEFFTVPPESSFLGGATYRDKIRGALRYLGLDNRALNYVVGDSRADNLVDNVGLFDLTPFAIPLAVQEGSRSMDQGRYLEGTLDLGLSALEMAPGAKLLTGPAKSFFSSIASKIKGSADNLGSLENITKDIPQENIPKNIWEETGYPSNMKEEDKSFVIQRMMELGNDPANPYLSGETGMQMLFKEKYGLADTSRREFLTKAGTAAVAAPIVAGALGDLPVGKIIDDLVPVSELPAAKVAAKSVAKVVKNVGQPARISVINDLMDITSFGEQYSYGGASMKEIVAEFSSEINKAKKYFELKKKTVDIDELDMLSPNNEMAERLDELQIEFGYSDDQMIKFIDETNSATKENEKVFGRYLIEGEGDPETGKALGLDGDDWDDTDFWEKIYGSFEEDIAGNRIAQAE
tara:strand:+ start:2068 stop:3396 length:1329 start_codon:yes stop_codon:yes gene_type:complete